MITYPMPGTCGSMVFADFWGTKEETIKFIRNTKKNYPTYSFFFATTLSPDQKQAEEGLKAEGFIEAAEAWNKYGTTQKMRAWIYINKPTGLAGAEKKIEKAYSKFTRILSQHIGICEGQMPHDE